MYSAHAGGCRLLIFDCDGVLVDSERISHEVLAEMLAEQGLVLSLEETVTRFIGASTARCAEQLDELLGAGANAQFMPEFGRRCREAFSAGLLPVAGIAALLAALPMPFCVASNGNHAKMKFTLAHTGLLPLFSGRIFSADDVARPKPAPDLFLHAARCQGVAPADCAVVEDTPTGIAAARAAGMRAYGYAAMTPAALLHAAGAHQVFDRMADLPSLLSHQGARP